MKRSYIHSLLLLLLSLVQCEIAFAVSSDAHREIIYTEISRGNVNQCVLRDKYGFLWVGTTTGLRCFDGNGQPVYHNTSGLLRPTENDNINVLYECGENIWFGGSLGLYEFDRENNEVKRFPYTTQYGVPVSSRVQKIKDVGDGLIWICTHGQGFFIYDSVERVLVQNSRHGSFYSDIVIGSDGLVYLVSMDGNIQAFLSDGSYVRSLYVPEYVTDKNRICMVTMGNDIWFSSGSSLYCFDLSTSLVERHSVKLFPNVINALFAQENGMILLGTDNGLWQYDTINGNMDLLSSTDFGMVDKINYLGNDRDGSVIISSPSSGISFMLTQESPFHFVALRPDGKRFNYVNALCHVPSRNEVWVGSEQGLFCYRDSLQSKSYSPYKLLSDIAITSIAICDNDLWIGTRHSGLFLYDLDRGIVRNFKYDENRPYTVLSNEIRDVYCNSHGEIFVLTNWGLCKYNRATQDFRTFAEIGQQFQFVTMCEDKYGRLWTSTENNGLLVRQGVGSKFDLFDSKTIGNGHVAIMLLDSDGNFWVATQNSGVFYYDEESKDFVSLEMPMLRNRNIIFMEEDADGNLWVGLADGLVQIDIQRNTHYYTFNYGSGILTESRTSCRGDGSNILIGSNNGFVYFDPKTLSTNDDLVDVYPVAISFPYLDDDKDELVRNDLDILLYTREKITLPYRNNAFTLRFAASRFGDMPMVRYDYMLKGIDKGWINGVNIPEAAYANLPPGVYEFMLRPNSVSNSVPKRLLIEILPPWYRSSFAYLSYFVLAVLVGYFIYLGVRRKIRRHYEKRINEMRMQQEREVFEAKTRFFVDLVHEIRTPLTLISIPLEQLTEELLAGNVLTGSIEDKNIKSMQRNLDYLLEITNQLLDFRKVENNNEVRLNMRCCDVKQLLTNIYRRFDQPMVVKGKVMKLVMPESDVYATFDTEKINRVLMNLLGNAMKYSRNRVDVALSIADADSQIVISVSDDGPGIAVEERERIFDTYYQIGNDDVAASLGTGLGLAYAKLIADTHGGSISVRDNDGGGTVFSLSIPIIKSNADCAESADVEELADKNINLEDLPNGFSILVVDDNKELLRMVSGALGRSNNVITAVDGVDALVRLKDAEVDVIVSDVMMPRMNGVELCRRVKRDVNYSHIPFVMLTAKTGKDAMVEGLEVGADVYLEKPFTIKQLNLQIANLMHTRKLIYERISAGQSIEKTIKDSYSLNRQEVDFIKNMNKLILDNVSDEEFSIDVLAENLNMSRSSFYRKIKGITGMTPVDYLKNFRLDYSAQLLREGGRATEVALMTGFTSSSYFAKCFKEKFGVLPRDYASTIGS